MKKDWLKKVMKVFDVNTEDCVVWMQSKTMSAKRAKYTWNKIVSQRPYIEKEYIPSFKSGRRYAIFARIDYRLVMDTSLFDNANRGFIRSVPEHWIELSVSRIK